MRSVFMEDEGWFHPQVAGLAAAITGGGKKATDAPEAGGAADAFQTNE